MVPGHGRCAGERGPARRTGLVRRLASPEDRRGAFVQPTPEGRTAFLRAAAVHGRVVEQYFVKPLAAEDYAHLKRAGTEGQGAA